MHPDLTDQDVTLLRSLPIAVVSTAALVEVTGGQCTMAELLAGLRGIIEADASLDNRLIALAFEAYSADGAGEAELFALCQDPPPDLRETTLRRCREASVHFGVAPDEWAGLRRWLLDLATAVVEASTTGGFLGLGGERVTEGEAALLADLAAALGAVEA